MKLSLLVKISNKIYASIAFVFMFITIGHTEFEDHFIWKMGDQYEDVLSKLDWTDPYNCKEKKDLFRYPIAIDENNIINGFYAENGTINNLPIKSANVVKVTNFVTDTDCEIEKVEYLNFCESNGELVYSVITYPLNQNEDFSKILNKDYEIFIGPYDNDVLKRYRFKNSVTEFLSENKDKNLNRISAIWEHPSDRDRKFVIHSIIKINKKGTDYQHNLCANNDNSSKIILDIKKPKIRNLEKIYSTSSSVIREFEIKRSMFNGCLSSFPNNKDLYETYWDSYLKNNQSLYFDVSNKFDQIMNKLSSAKLRNQYVEKLDKVIKFSNNPSMWESFEDSCNNIMSKEAPYIKDEIEKRFNKKERDIDLVLNFNIE